MESFGGSDKAAVSRDLYKGPSQVDVHVGSLQIRGLDCREIRCAQGVINENARNMLEALANSIRRIISNDEQTAKDA
jgi:hypothetical protein